MPFPAGRDGARPLQENGSRPAHGGVRSPRPTDASQVVPSNGPPGRRALRMVAESRRDCPGQRRTAERLRRGREGWVEVGAEITPKGAINLGQSLSHGEAVTAPFAQGSLGTGDADCRVGPLGLLAMTKDFCHSEERSDVGIRFFLRWTGVRAAEVVGPYGKPKPAGAQRSARASVGEGWAGIGARTIPKRGPPPRPPRQRLAKRKARKEQLVKFSLCPIPSECSTAY